MELDDIETAVAQTPAASEPVSHRDDIDNDIRASIAQLKAANEPAQEAAPVDDHPEPVAKADHPSDPNRYADGTWKKTKAEIAAEAAPAELPSTDTTKAIEPQVSTPAIEPPVGWTAAEKADWSKLPPAVQAAVNRREQEISRGGQQWSEEKRRYEAVLAPAAQAFKARNLSVEDGINRLLQAQDFLDRDPSSAVQWLAQSYGVDLANLASNPPAPQAPRFDPVVQQFEQKVSYLENQLNGFLQNQTLGVVEQFSQGKPHYADVEGDMVNIIPLVQQQNPGASPQVILEKAYEQALWTNPQVREKLIAEKQAQSQQQKAEAVNAKAQQAAKAAVSIKGSSGGVSVSRKPPAELKDETPYETVARTIRELRAQ